MRSRPSGIDSSQAGQAPRADRLDVMGEMEGPERVTGELGIGCPHPSIKRDGTRTPA